MNKLKKMLALTMVVVVLATMFAVPALAAVTTRKNCVYCGGTTTWKYVCRGSAVTTSVWQTCPSGNGCTYRYHYYDSYVKCTSSGCINSDSAASHKHYEEHSSCGRGKFNVCNY